MVKGLACGRVLPVAIEPTEEGVQTRGERDQTKHRHAHAAPVGPHFGNTRAR